MMIGDSEMRPLRILTSFTLNFVFGVVGVIYIHMNKRLRPVDLWACLVRVQGNGAAVVVLRRYVPPQRNPRVGWASSLGLGKMGLAYAVRVGASSGAELGSIFASAARRFVLVESVLVVFL